MTLCPPSPARRPKVRTAKGSEWRTGSCAGPRRTTPTITAPETATATSTTSTAATHHCHLKTTAFDAACAAAFAAAFATAFTTAFPKAASARVYGAERREGSSSDRASLQGLWRPEGWIPLASRVEPSGRDASRQGSGGLSANLKPYQTSQ